MSGFILSEASESRKEKSGKFRLNSKTLFVTFPKCPKLPEELLEHLQKIFKLETYLIAREQHMDGSFHLHAYLSLEKKVNIKDERKCDWKVDDVTYHPNMQGCRSPKAVLKYVCNSIKRAAKHRFI